jgi:hypothetical protein
MVPLKQSIDCVVIGCFVRNLKFLFIHKCQNKTVRDTQSVGKLRTTNMFNNNTLFCHKDRSRYHQGMTKPLAGDSKSAVRARVAQWAEASEKLNHERDINLAKTRETQSLAVFDGMLPLAIAAHRASAANLYSGLIEFHAVLTLKGAR